MIVLPATHDASLDLPRRRRCLQCKRFLLSGAVADRCPACAAEIIGLDVRERGVVITPVLREYVPDAGETRRLVLERLRRDYARTHPGELEAIGIEIVPEPPPPEPTPSPLSRWLDGAIGGRSGDAGIGWDTFSVAWDAFRSYGPRVQVSVVVVGLGIIASVGIVLVLL